MLPPARDEIYRALESMARQYDLDYFAHPVHYRSGEFIFPKMASRNMRAQDKVMMVGAGVHANEVAGPATLVIRGRELMERAMHYGIKVILYPLRNPSGYGVPGKRYNIDEVDDSVPVGNNDFVRYELADGQVVDDLRDSNLYHSWGWSSEPRYRAVLPPETQLMHALLKQDPLPLVCAVIDLHQDYIMPEPSPLAYHYAFGDLSAYAPIIRKIERVIPIARQRLIGAGYRGVDESGRVTLNAPGQAIRTNENGFIVRHDGSWTDLMWRIGESYGHRVHCITPETTGATPLDLAAQVNLIWLTGIMDLIAADEL